MKNYQQLAKEARKKVLEMVYRGQTSHIASNFSCIDIATVLYENLKQGDEILWSKGWAAATIYYFLSKQGKIPAEALDKFPNPPYLGLAETEVNGVHVSSGSMGHGLPVAVGMALGKKLKGEEGMIYCIMSDGELNEGTTWESALLAAQHKLDNLIVLIDSNGWQAMGKTNEILPSTFPSWATVVHSDYGRQMILPQWYVRGGNGHDYTMIESLLIGETERMRDLFKKGIVLPGPLCYDFETIKGKGVSFMENHLTFHYKHVDKETYELALKELENA